MSRCWEEYKQKFPEPGLIPETMVEREEREEGGEGVDGGEGGQ